MIKAVVFDLWETIGTKGFRVSKSLREHFNIKTPDFLERYERSLQLKEWKNIEEMAKNFLINFNINVNEENINFVIDIIQKGIDKATIFRGMKVILGKLKNKYKLALLSNTTNFESKVISKWNLNKYFDIQIYSYQINSLKPSNRNFDEICKKLNLKPNECLFIDNEERSIEAARKLGFKTITFQNVEQLKKELTPYIQ